MFELIRHRLVPLIFLPVSALICAQKVGIGTTNPASTLHIVSSGSTTGNSFIARDSLSNVEAIMTDAGTFGIGKTSFKPDAQLTVFGINNNTSGTIPSFRSTAKNSNTGLAENFAIYINPTPGAFNPASMGFFNWITDNDGQPSVYNHIVTGGSYNGAAFSNNRADVPKGTPNGTSVGTSNRDSGIFLREAGPVLFSVYRDDATGFNSDGSAAYTTGSVKIADEGKGYNIGGVCSHPGTIAFDSTNNNFLGCTENFSADGNTVLSTTWKRLNNN